MTPLPTGRLGLVGRAVTPARKGGRACERRCSGFWCGIGGGRPADGAGDRQANLPLHESEPTQVVRTGPGYSSRRSMGRLGRFFHDGMLQHDGSPVWLQRAQPRVPQACAGIPASSPARRGSTGGAWKERSRRHHRRTGARKCGSEDPWDMLAGMGTETATEAAH